jgi:metallo-beta-lactamase family protein
MRAGQKLLQPLYDDDDVQTALRQMQPLPYGEAVNVAPSVDVTAYESGHVLGSVSLALRVHENGAIRDIVFSGDIGPCGMPILRDPEPPPHADLVFLESTYGDRDHRPLAETIAEFKTILRTAYADQGKILVPAFAVGRSQQILYHLAEFFREGVVPPFPIYLDSPMAIKATALYSKFPGLADEEASELNRSGRLRRDLATLHNTLSSQDSRAINDVDGPCLIIAGSGMATGGRILHHLKHNLWKPETDVVIVGYQGVGTLGRQLVEGAQRVRIFGEPIAVRAAIHTLGGFSAHAGQSELLDWLAPMASTRPRVVLTHGEDAPRAALAAKIAERYAIQALLPKLDQVIEL